jgi:hypothetical protein
MSGDGASQGAGASESALPASGWGGNCRGEPLVPVDRDDGTQQAPLGGETQAPAESARLRHLFRRGFQVLALATVVWLLVRITLFGLEVQNMAYGAGCHKNLLQVSLALNMYAQDWDGRLPPSSHWMDRAHSYTKTWSVLRCPAIGDKEPTHFGYAFNDRLAGRWIEKFKRPETIPLIYDSSNLARNAADPVTSLPNPPRHLRNRAVYLDHQVRIPTRQEADRR